MRYRIPVLAVLFFCSLSTLQAQNSDSSVEVEVADVQATPFGVSLTLESSQSRQQTLYLLVGTAEGEAIARALHHQNAPRPMTHDLLKEILDRNGWKVQKVLIRDYSGDSFRADMTLEKGDETEVYDCRPSDAIAVGLLYNAKIYVSAHVFDQERQNEQKEPDNSQPDNALPSTPDQMKL